MARLVHFIVLALVLCCSAEYYSQGNEDLQQAFSAAINDFLTAQGDNTFKSVFETWFPGINMSTPYDTCEDDYWPPQSGFTGTMKSIIERGYILIGAPIPAAGNYPKRFNYTAVPNTTYGTLSGLEPDIANALLSRINIHYYLDPPLKSYWVNQTWFASYKNNIITSLNTGEFDIIIASLSIDGTWEISNGSVVTRDSLIDFTCPYQIETDSAIKGPKDLPSSAKPLSTLNTLDQDGLICCANKGTTADAWAKLFLKKTTLLSIAEGSAVITMTLNQTCHYYLSPTINGLEDVKKYPEFSYIIAVTETSPLGIGIRKDESSSGIRLSVPYWAMIFKMLVAVLA